MIMALLVSLLLHQEPLDRCHRDYQDCAQGCWEAFPDRQGDYDKCSARCLRDWLNCRTELGEGKCKRSSSS